MEEIVEGSTVLLCCGTGGVGKTTTAAALALGAAQRRGRRAVVVTIDPAKRLADALGLGELDNTPRPVEIDAEGELWAMMLDSKRTFDELVRREAKTDAQAERILSNRYYQNLSTALSGTQEYMATEKLYELHAGGEFDLIVVDTPPSRSALDFLDAPGRLIRFLDGRIMRVASPSGMVRALNAAVKLFLRQVAKVVSAEVVDDTLAFLAAFDGMEQGFRDRARGVDELMNAPATAFILVATPRREALEEGGYFVERLQGLGLDIRALVVNRMHPRFAVGDSDDPHLLELSGLAREEEDLIEPLAASVEPAVVVQVPHLRGDVHDLEGVAAIAAHLYAEEG